MAPGLGADGESGTPPNRVSPQTEKHMNALTRWDPFKELEAMQNRVAKLFELAPMKTNGEKETMAVADWTPSVDVVEDEKEWVVKTDLPEVKKDQIKVTVENGVLTITGERKAEKEEKGKKYHRIERSYGSFMRGFTLPDGADAAKVNAEFKEGVLTVHVPKGEKAQPKPIDVKVAA